MLSTKRAKVTLVQETENTSIVSLPTENIQTIFLSLFRDDSDRNWDKTVEMRKAFASAWRLAVTCKRMRSVFLDIVDRMCSRQCQDIDIAFTQKWIIQRASHVMIERELDPQRRRESLWARPPPVHPFMANAFYGDRPSVVSFVNADLRALGRVIMLGTSSQTISIEDCLFVDSNITIICNSAYIVLRNSMNSHGFNPQGDEAVDTVNFTFRNACHVTDKRCTNLPMTIDASARGGYVTRCNRALGIEEYVHIEKTASPIVFRAMASGHPYRTSARNTDINVYFPAMFYSNGPTQVYIAHKDTQIARFDDTSVGILGMPFVSVQLDPGTDLAPRFAQFHVVEGNNVSIKRMICDVKNSTVLTCNSAMSAVRGHLLSTAHVSIYIHEMPLQALLLPGNVNLRIYPMPNCITEYIQETVTEDRAREFYQRTFDFTDALQNSEGNTIEISKICPPMDIVHALMEARGRESVLFEENETVDDNTSVSFLAKMHDTFRATDRA
jgi:hypothetical protein